jgi:uncharacterized protein YyaL (SSP411 family)
MLNWIVWTWKTRAGTKTSRLVVLLSVLLLSDLAQAAGPLTDHPSPYVRMHANDAVKWRLLDADVLEQAQRQNKLLFISSGYFACHWCHVMRDESFNNAQVAALLNRNFIAVKIDRELNPVLDAYLMNFLQRSRGFGGWPLNMFLTPDGYPLYGLVYLPRNDFIALLQRMNNDWQKRGGELRGLAQQAFEQTRSESAEQVAMPDADALLDRLLAAVRDEADDFLGGFGEQARFPRAPLLLNLLEAYQLRSDPWLGDFLLLTLNQMASKGLHDVIGGGFFRYTTDPQWQAPHFEKMLYTNAGLVLVYARAYEIFDEPRFLQLAEQTMAFMLRDMRNEQGFISALSALDAQGREGGYYLWTHDQLQDALKPAQWRRVERHWQLASLEGGMLPMAFTPQAEWQAIRERLRQQRQPRGLPRDDKILPAWNGYALSALAKVTALTGRKDFLQQGRRLYDQFKDVLQKDVSRAQAGLQRRYLQDQVLLVRGLVDWMERAEGRVVDDERLRARLIRIVDRFWSADGWQQTDSDVIPLPGRALNLADDELPAADALLIGLLRRSGVGDSKALRAVQSASARRVDARLLADPLSYASHILRQQSRSGEMASE